MAPYSGPTRSPISTNDRTEPAIGRPGGRSPRRAVLLANVPTDLAPARASGRLMPSFDEPIGAPPRRMELRAGERLSVASRITSDGARSGIARTAAIVAVAFLAGIGIMAVLHTFGPGLPF